MWRALRWTLRMALLMLGPLAIAGLGGYFYMKSGRYVTTENAYVKADLVVISAEVSGQVTEVAVADNQRVAAGDLLFRLDARRFAVARDRLAAELDAARQRVQALKARYGTKLAELAAAERDMEFMTDELRRSESLRARGTISESTVLEDRRLSAQAENRIRIAREQITEVLAELAGDPLLPVDSHPDVQRATADLVRAELDLEATAVRAPTDAIAANVRLQPGEYVEDGDAVLSLVSVAGFWVEANLKETDLTHLREGQAAVLTVDAYPEVEWRAHVASLSPATGAEYALLPPQNASGNWVKVVQRVPVRLEIAPGDDTPPLRAGMSVSVSIDTEFQRPMPEFVTTARAWILPGE